MYVFYDNLNILFCKTCNYVVFFYIKVSLLQLPDYKNLCLGFPKI